MGIILWVEKMIPRYALQNNKIGNSRFTMEWKAFGEGKQRVEREQASRFIVWSA